ncbi:hypothetical protein WA026_008264 [Henosepilachna vigintioctopunctata]|uniref:Uncharacterized protein n=1 Tax=Henosepilachna vigintioctopunctata TaxID=420089 RepID=A0AAW1TRJ5_9CUCU
MTIRIFIKDKDKEFLNPRNYIPVPHCKHRSPNPSESVSSRETCVSPEIEFTNTPPSFDLALDCALLINIADMRKLPYASSLRSLLDPCLAPTNTSFG